MSARTAPTMPAPVSCAISRWCHTVVVFGVPTTGTWPSTKIGVDIAKNARSTAAERCVVSTVFCEPIAPGSLDSLKNTYDASWSTIS